MPFDLAPFSNEEPVISGTNRRLLTATVWRTSIMDNPIKHLAISVLTTLALIFSTHGAASERPENITDAEWAMLPPYCPYTMGFKGHTQPHISKWVGVMGDGFFHMHHNCWALIDFRRAERAGVPATEKKFLRQRALGGFKYVVRNAPDDFVLLPELYTWIGRTELLLDNPRNASEAFTQAQQRKPDYWPAYYHWAEFLQSHGKKAQALDVIKAGLQFSPDAKPLLLLFRQLGGRQSDTPQKKSQTEQVPTQVDQEVKTEAIVPGSESQGK